MPKFKYLDRHKLHPRIGFVQTTFMVFHFGIVEGQKEDTIRTSKSFSENLASVVKSLGWWWRILTFFPTPQQIRLRYSKTCFIFNDGRLSLIPLIIMLLSYANNYHFSTTYHLRPCEDFSIFSRFLFRCSSVFGLLSSRSRATSTTAMSGALQCSISASTSPGILPSPK